VTLRTVRGRCPLCPSGTPAPRIAQGRDFEYRTTAVEFTVVRCDGCGIQFLDPRPADDEIAGLYPDTYEPYRFDGLPAPVRAARDFVQAAKVRAIARHAPPGSRVLDLGCGGGTLLRLMQRRGDPSWKLAGWDYPGPHVARLAADGFDVLQAPIAVAHVRPRSADVVVMNQVIEHFAAPDEVLRLVKALLVPGGVAFIETPDTRGLDARLFRSRHWGGYHFPRHLVLFDAANLSRLLEREGFSIVSVEHLASPAFWVQTLHHALEETRFAFAAPFFTASNPIALGAATAVDLVTMRLRPTSNLRVVARAD
jgi:SAM-dependent methyltransferase